MKESRHKSVRRFAVILIALLTFAPHLFAAEDDANPWTKLAARFVIGNVTVQLTNLEVHVMGRNVNVTLPWEMYAPGEYFCAVRNPFAKPRMEDGVIIKDANYRVLEKDDHDFTAKNFRRFAFFTKRPTTIGLLAGHAGNDGGSHQKLLLVDVETGTHLLFELGGGNMPKWLKPTNFPVAFITRHFMGYKGWHELCLGQSYRFKNGRYQRDTVTEQRLLANKFRKIKFTAAQRKELQTPHQSPLDDWMSPTQAGQTLGDYVYYGTLTGNHSKVDALLKSLLPELRDNLDDLRQEIYAASRNNIVTGTVAPAPNPLGDGIAPPRHQRPKKQR